MGSSKTMDQLKTKYRIRFFQNRAENSLGLRPRTKVLSTLTDYFNDPGAGDSPAIRSSFFADSVTNIDTPESIQKKQDSSTIPHISILKVLPFTGEIKETKMKATTSRTVIEKEKPLPRFNNFNVEVLPEEMDYSEYDMPLNLVVEKGTGTKNISVRNASRDRVYSSDNSVVQGLPSPVSKSSPQKRLRFSDSVLKDKEGFQSVFVSRSEKGPADVQPKQMPKCITFHGNMTDARSSVTAAPCVSEEEDEFIIEGEKSINMSFSFANKRSSVGTSKETRSTASSSTCGSQKLQSKAYEVPSRQSPFCLSMGNQPTRKENYSNVKRWSTTDESRNILTSEKIKETKCIPSTAASGSPKFPVKSKDVPAQSPVYSKIEQTRQFIRALDTVEDEHFDQISGADRERIKIPRNSKSKAEGTKSGSVLHEMLTMELAETVSEQSTLQSQTVRNTLKDDKTNKAKDKLCKDKNSFTSHLVKNANSDPPIERMDISDFDLPVVAEEEFVYEISDFDLESWDKKTNKIPNDRKKKKKSEKNVPSDVPNVPFTSAMDRDHNLTDSKKNHNNATDSVCSSKDTHKKKRRTEVEKLTLLEGWQKEIDEISNVSRRRRLTPEVAAWQAVKNCTFEIKDAFLQRLLESNISEESMDNIYKLKERGPQDQDEEGSLTQNDEKNSKTTLNTRKRTKKLKPVQSQEKAGPSKVKIPKNNKKLQTSTKKSLQSTNLCRQLEHETLENYPTNYHEHDLNVHDLPNENLHLSKAALPASPTISGPQSPSPQSPTFESDIQLEYLENCNTEERETQSHHSTALQPSLRAPIQPTQPSRDPDIIRSPPWSNTELPRQSHTSPACDSAKLTFQSGPVLKTRAVRHDNQMDTLVRNLTAAGSFSIADLSPMTVVLDPDTNSDALAECIHHADNDKQRNSLMSKCFNNHIFSAGKLVLKPMEKEERNTPQSDILVFYIVKGKAILKLHKSYHSLKSGDFFFIPPSNTYNIHNNEKEDAELIFTQLKGRAD